MAPNFCVEHLDQKNPCCLTPRGTKSGCCPRWGMAYLLVTVGGVHPLAQLKGWRLSPSRGIARFLCFWQLRQKLQEELKKEKAMTWWKSPDPHEILERTLQRYRKKKMNRPLANTWVVGWGFEKQSFNLELLDTHSFSEVIQWFTIWDNEIPNVKTDPNMTALMLPGFGPNISSPGISSRAFLDHWMQRLWPRWEGKPASA